jgi:hypothetical protein
MVNLSLKMEGLPVSKDVLAGMPHSLDTGALRQNTQISHLKYQCGKRKIYKRKYNTNILSCTIFIFNRKAVVSKTVLVVLIFVMTEVLMRFPL